MGAVKKLTPKQTRFVEAYCGVAAGNATEAARLAGYKGNNETLQTVGSENLRKPLVAEAIAAKAPNKPLEDAGQRLRRFWMETIEKGEADPSLLKEALKASELYGKATGQFIKKVEHSGSLGVRVQTIEVPVKEVGE